MYGVDIGIPSRRFSGTATNGITGTSATAVSGSQTAISAASASSAVGAAKPPPSRIAVTHFSGSSDIATLYTIESPAGTAVWQKYRGGTNNDLDEQFDPPLEVGTVGATVVFKAAVAATSKTQINWAGFELAAGQ